MLRPLPINSAASWVSFVKTFHIEQVATWIDDARRAEPVAKCLRGDLTLDPLSEGDTAE